MTVATAFACSPASLGAKDDERFALDFLQLVRRARTDDALASVDPSLRISSTRAALEEVHRSLPAGEPVRVDTTGSFVLTNLRTGERTANLTFQLEYASTWFLANVVVRTAGSNRSVERFQVRQLPDSLQRLNAFTLRKSPRQLVFLVIASLAFASSAAAVVVCARSRIRRKPLWLLISALGVGQILVDWTTGATTTRPVSVQLFSVGVTRANEYAPWILGISLPLGALLFFGLRRKLTVPEPAPPSPG